MVMPNIEWKDQGSGPHAPLVTVEEPFTTWQIVRRADGSVALEVRAFGRHQTLITRGPGGELRRGRDVGPEFEPGLVEALAAADASDGPRLAQALGRCRPAAGLR